MMHEHYRVDVSYDASFDLLSFRRPGIKSSGAIRAGAFVIDFFKDELAGLEIEGASSLFTSLFGQSIDLAKLSNAKIGLQEKNNMLLLFFVFSSGGNHYQKEIVIPKTQPIPALG